MNWLRKFMIGRYGSDRLSMFLLIISMVLTLIGSLLKMPVLNLIGYVPMLISIYRILSTNLTRRRMENYKFVMLMNPLNAWLRKTTSRITNYIRYGKTHRHFKCPDCKAQLRVPKGKGTIIITCPKCRTEFKKRT